MAEGPIERIVRQSEVADLVDILTERLAPTDLQSLLLEVYRREGCPSPRPLPLSPPQRSWARAWFSSRTST